MSKSERKEQLILSGWHIYRIFPRWVVFYRRNNELMHHYFNGLGMEFITVFDKNGRTAYGHINP